MGQRHTGHVQSQSHALPGSLTWLPEQQQTRAAGRWWLHRWHEWSWHRQGRGLSWSQGRALQTRATDTEGRGHTKDPEQPQSGLWLTQGHGS